MLPILKETKDSLNKAISERDELQNNLSELYEDKEKLTNEVNYLNSLCEKVLSGMSHFTSPFCVTHRKLRLQISRPALSPQLRKKKCLKRKLMNRN